MKKYLTPESIYKQERQIKDAVWINKQFILTQQEVLDILNASKCRYRKQTLMRTKALELIEQFKVLVTPKVWKDWVNWNEGDDRISNIINLFHEMYSNGNLLKLNK